MNNKNKNTYRNVTITSIIAAILVTSGIGVAYASDDSEGHNDSSTTATGHDSSAFGWSTTASGDRSAAFGIGTDATGGSSAAFGSYTTASGGNSAAFGSLVVASGTNSAAFGSSTTASGTRSTAFGSSTTASGDYSTAFGYNTEAKPYASFVIGKYNEISGTTGSWVATDPLFVIGNGASAGSPSNAVTVLKNGNVGIGDSSPNSKLHVLTDGTSTFTSAANRGILITDSLGPRLVLEDTGEGTDEKVMIMRYEDEILSFNAINDSGSSWVTQNILTMDRSGNVGIGASSPNSQLEVTGYFELATSSGTPPSADCNAADEIGRMKVDSTSRKLYVCTYDGTTYAWLTLQ